MNNFSEKVSFIPDAVPNIEMGYIFEELIRRFNEASNEEAVDHFPRAKSSAWMKDSGIEWLGRVGNVSECLGSIDC